MVNHYQRDLLIKPSAIRFGPSITWKKNLEGWSFATGYKTNTLDISVKSRQLRSSRVWMSYWKEFRNSLQVSFSTANENMLIIVLMVSWYFCVWFMLSELLYQEQKTPEWGTLIRFEQIEINFILYAFEMHRVVFILWISIQSCNGFQTILPK